MPTLWEQASRPVPGERKLASRLRTMPKPSLHPGASPGVPV